MADVARAAGHSLSTVDRVLNGRSAVRADTAVQIHDAAQALGYRAAGVLRERLRGLAPALTLGFLMPGPEAPFYRALGEALAQAVADRSDLRARALFEPLRGMAPDAVAEQLLALAGRVDALALVAADHPVLHEAVAQVAARGVPVFTLLSDLDTPAVAGHVGLDNRRVGRTAAWFVTRLARRPGPLAVFIGTHRFQCQELCEMSFRAWVREQAPQFELLETRVTLESDDHAEEAMRDLLARHDDLAGFYVGGGGIEGCLRALAGTEGLGVVGVTHELNATTRRALLRGPLVAVLSEPMPALAAELVALMRRACVESAAVATDPGDAPPPRRVLLPFTITVPDSA